MKNRCVQIVHFDSTVDRMEAELIGLAYAPRLAAAPGHPHGKGVNMVVASNSTRCFWLCYGRAAKFPAPNDERLIQ